MLNPTKRQLAQRYMLKLAGDYPTDDFKADERLFLQEINQAIAIVAKDSAIESVNAEGIMFANDQFIVPYRNIDIKQDSSNEFKYSILPDTPIGIVKGRGLVMVLPPLGSENSLKPIALREVPFLFHQPKIPKVIFYWIEGGLINYYPQPNFTKVSMKMITSGIADVDTPLTIPPDVLNKIEKIVMDSILIMFKIKPDIINDGEPE